MGSRSIVDTAVAEADAQTSPAGLAARYGLSIAGARPGLLAYTKQIWAYRHFIVTFANSQLAAAFSTARLGRLWQVLTPLTNAGVYYLIFGVILNTKHGIPNFIAYLCIGVFIFGYTSQVVTGGTQAITRYLGLIRALHFPRASLPLAITAMQLQNLIASMIVLMAIVIGTGEPITMRWLLMIPALVLQSMFNAGLALALARVGAKMVDFKQLIPFIMRTWMYASGVMYSATLFADHLPHAAAEVLKLNPMLVYVELIRYALLRTATLASPADHLWLIGGFWAVIGGILGYIYFWRGEQEYGRG